MPTITLQVLEGPDRGRVYRDLNLPVTIGRNEGNTVHLDDHRVSRYHAKIQFDDGNVIVTDLESVNGTRVNGEAVQLRRLQPGDKIEVGRCLLLFGSPAEIATRRAGPARPTAQDVGNVRDFRSGDPGHADLLDECRNLRLSLDSGGVFCRNADARGLTTAVLDAESQARTILSEGFHRFVVVDAARGHHPDTGYFEPIRFLTEVCQTLGRTFGIELDPARFHAADVFQVLKDEPPSLFGFVHFECVSKDCLPLVRAFTQGVHRALFLNDGDESPLDDVEYDMPESVLADAVVQSGGTATGPGPAETLERISKLIQADVALAQESDVDAHLNAIAEACFEQFRLADRFFIVLKEASTLVGKVTKSRRPADAFRFSETLVRQCLESRSIILIRDPDQTEVQSNAEPSFRSAIYSPLIGVGGLAFGALAIDSQDRNRKFVPDDAETLQLFANLASAAIEKRHLFEESLEAREIQRDLEIARGVQLRFLPSDMPLRPGYAFHAVETASLGVSGDFAYFLDRPDGTVVALLGDVAGKGVSAGLILARLIGEIQHGFANQRELSRAVGAVNNAMTRSGNYDRFITMVAIALDPATHRVAIVNAGHIAPRRLRTRDRSFDLAIPRDQSGLPLGILENFEYAAVELDLEPGDRLIAFTDGVTDAPSPSEKMFGDAGVAAALDVESFDRPYADPKELCERLHSAVQKHSHGRQPYDDIGILCLGRDKPL